MKLLIVVVVFSMATDSFAQTFGVKAGLNLSNMIVKDNTETYSGDFKMKPGFNLGGTVEFPINEIFSFETGLILSTKGYKATYEDFGGETKETYNLYYFDIPLTGKATYDVGSFKIFGVFGPYIGIGLSGKGKSETDGVSDPTHVVKWGTDSDNDELKRLDMGLTFGAGVEISSVQIRLNYDLGIKNISSDTGDGYKITNRVLGISLGYKFGGK